MSNTIPAIYSGSLEPASVEEVKESLKPLLAQWASQAAGGEGKVLGYYVALDGQPKWAIDRVVARFITGRVPTHNPAYLPTSAEVGIEVRKEVEDARKYHERSLPKPRPEVLPDLSLEELQRRSKRVEEAKRLIFGAVNHMDVTPKESRG